jgi:hypothetical protein
MAVICGGLVAVFPFAAGLGVLVHPLRRKSGNGGEAATDGAKFLPVCPLAQLPADGVPRRYSLSADVIDAWSHRLNQPVGAVYLTRAANDTSEESPAVTAFTTTCPHLGCAIEFDAAEKQFECPCHKSGFAIDGKQLFGPSRRGLDSLEVKLAPHAGQATIWVAYQRFRTGIPEKEPVA